MTTVVPTPEAVWEVINADPEFLESSKPIREAMRPYVEALPVILADQLQDKVTFDSLKKAKLVFLQYCMANGFVQAMVEAMPHPLRSRSNMPELIEKSMNQVIEATANGSSRAIQVQNLSSYMNEKAMALYESGALTIGGLLMVHPMYMVANTD